MHSTIWVGDFLSKCPPCTLQAFTFLAELVHNSRRSLKHAELAKAITLFIRTCYDSSLQLSVHATAIRVLSSLVETLHLMGKSTKMEVEAQVKARQLLDRILECLLSQMKHLQKQVGA